MTNYELSKKGLKKTEIHYPIYRSDLACKCGCGLNIPDPHLLNRLQALQERIKTRVYITSGCRCKTHNARVSKALNSFHLYGKAVDIWSKNHDPLTLGMYAHAVGFTGIIVHQNFVHIDVRPDAYMQLNMHLFVDETIDPRPEN